MAVLSDDIAQVRAFNRFYTSVIGLLAEGMHESPFTLAEARVIYELGRRKTATASSIAEPLGMDRGRMSRLVLKLVDAGVVALLPRQSDRRSAPLALTREGDAVYRRFNEMSDKLAATTLLEPLDAFQRRDLVGSMRRIQAMLAEPDDEPLILRPHRVGEIGWLIHRQGLLYHLEQGWNGEFELLIAKLYGDFVAAPATPPKGLWIAERGGEIAGSVYIVPAAATESEGTAQLRMLYVEPAFRGQGVGNILVQAAVRFSREAGYGRIILWTQDCLAGARHIYQKAGFKLLREEPHHSFGVDLTGQYWALDL